MSTRICYIPGQSPASSAPLGRFLPPVLEGVAESWLAEGPPKGSWLIDPFGASPRLAVEAASQGYRVIAAVNNPIARFLLEMHANPPLKSELRSALAALGSAQKGGERIEPHLRELYTTTCAHCEQVVETQAFIWERGAQAPSGRIYACPHCEDHGEKIASQQDAQRAAQFSAQSGVRSLHLARALERVASLNDPDRAYVKEAIESYLPRTVYALFTLVNKLDTLPDRQRELASALLLSAFDQSNTLWAYPSTRERPRALSVPPLFREKNVWLALEEAVDAWPTRPEDDIYTQTPLVTWPELPPKSGGISIFEGRLKDLADQIEAGSAAPLNISAVLTAMPRPNQAFWTLSALWSGWLWGQAAAAPFKSVLRRRRFDWAWHTTALFANFKNLRRVLSDNTPILGLIAEVEPGFLSAALTAAEIAGFKLEGVALRENQGQAQIHWRCTAEEKAQKLREASRQQISNTIQEATLTYLLERGEPASYLQLHTAALIALDKSQILVTPPSLPPSDALSKVQQGIQASLSEEGTFRRYGSSTHSLEVGRWWLDTSQAGATQATEGGSLSDKIEMLMVRYLVKHHTSSFEALEAALCEELCGLMTPEREIIVACLESYAEKSSPDMNEWQLRSQDKPQSRREDLITMRNLLHTLGESVGYQPLVQRASEGDQEASPNQPIIWEDENGKPVYLFFVLASAILGKILFSDAHSRHLSAAARKLIVIPGGRAGLVHYKLERDPRLTEAVDTDWEFVKFRHLRRLAEAARLDRENIAEQLLLDRLANTDPQMQLW